MGHIVSLVRSRALPPFIREAGAATGEHSDATRGLVVVPDPRPEMQGLPWFWNDRMGEWELSAILDPGATLEDIAELYYGAATWGTDTPLDGVSIADRVKQIQTVPQNQSIVGSGAWTDYDVILIPHQPQPPLPDPTQVPIASSETSPGVWPAGQSPTEMTPTVTPDMTAATPVAMTPATPAAPSAGMSTGEKIAIGVAAAAVIGAIGWLAFRKKRRTG